MNMLDRCTHYLSNYDVRYSHSIHSPAGTALEVADRDRVSPHEVAKAVAYIGDDGYGLAVVPADCAVDLSRVCMLLGLTSIRVASEAELELLLPGSEHGALPPFGALFGIPVILDSRLAEQDFIVCSAGTPRDVLRMSVVDFLRVVHPVVGSFALQMAEVG